MNDESNVPKAKTKATVAPKPADPFLNKTFVEKLHIIDAILASTVDASNQAWIQEQLKKARALLKLMWENE